MSILKPHRDVEFYNELSAMNDANKLYAAKFTEVKESMNTIYKEAGVKSPRLLFPSVEGMKNSLSLPNADGPMRSMHRLYALK